MLQHRKTILVARTIVVLVLAGWLVQSPLLPGEEPIAKPAPITADEPVAKEWSLARSAEYLDRAAMAWLDKQKCAACHTNYPYLMAGPSLAESPSPGLVRMRKFFEDRVANWDKDDLSARPDPGSEGVTEVVATAATLAFHDAQTTGKLHPLTRQALDRIWTLQQDNGAWDWNKHRLPPVEHDDYFGAVFAALGVGVAPEGYAQSDKARAGLAKLRNYFAKNPPPDLHHKTWLLWASLRLDGLMTPAEREQTKTRLLALQRDDGGWSLPSLGEWKRLDGTPNDAKAPSDGYATGLVLYVLRQAGLEANARPVERGAAWLKTHQRVSGRWFTRSLNADRGHYMTNAGTAFAVMALKGL
jgi:squalene-hopene/tetraprenyl-beta-curcumene cyclase